MAKASEVRDQKTSKQSPFGKPADDEVTEILIPEGAESGKIPADDQYIGRCLGFIQEESKKSGNPMLTWTFTMEEGDFIGMDFTLWTPMTANAMWKLADTLTALGVKWEPGVPLSLRSKDVKNVLVRMKIVDDNYEGRDRSKLQTILPHPDGAGVKAKGAGFKVPKKAEEDDEEEETPRRGRKPARDEEDEEEERPRRGRKARARDEDEDEDEEPATKKKGKGWFAPEEDEEEEERPRRGRKPAREEEEDEDDEDERPTRKSAKTSKRSRL